MLILFSFFNFNFYEICSTDFSDLNKAFAINQEICMCKSFINTHIHIDISICSMLINYAIKLVS